MQTLFPLINHKNEDIQAHAYFTLVYLADHLDCDEVAELMMSQLLCISWEVTDMDQTFKVARLSAVYFALLGRGKTEPFAFFFF